MATAQVGGFKDIDKKIMKLEQHLPDYFHGQRGSDRRFDREYLLSSWDKVNECLRKMTYISVYDGIALKARLATKCYASLTAFHYGSRTGIMSIHDDTPEFHDVLQQFIADLLEKLNEAEARINRSIFSYRIFFTGSTSDVLTTIKAPPEEMSTHREWLEKEKEQEKSDLEQLKQRIFSAEKIYSATKEC